ncbi:hypothetical protein [Mesorhizobium sp.]|nr:hypothetical protein [Mesorhizobium sp.]RWN40578.1 MAG: hypothetical protein EOS03_31825 [Mesorhizobium sp.]
MKNLAHSASLDSEDKDAPSKSGIKHLSVREHPYLETVLCGDARLPKLCGGMSCDHYSTGPGTPVPELMPF